MELFCHFTNFRKEFNVESDSFTHEISAGQSVKKWWTDMQQLQQGEGRRNSSVGKSSASQSGDSGSNPGGGLTQVIQCMNERRRDYQPILISLLSLGRNQETFIPT